MRWGNFYQRFQDEVMPRDQLRRMDFVYIIGHKTNEPPYKIGITQAGLYERLNSYQTAFVDFEIYYLIALPDRGALHLERVLHTGILQNDPRRIRFPQKRPDRQAKYSEWFDVPLGVIEKQILQAVRYDSTIQPFFAYDLRGNSIVRWKLLEDYRQPKPDEATHTTSTRSGRKVKRVERFGLEKSPYDYLLGKAVFPKVDDGSTGEVIAVARTRAGKGVVKWSDDSVPTQTPMKEIIAAVKLAASKR